MDVAEAVGRDLAAHGVTTVFGVVGSGNFHVTNALIAAGARFVPAAHEGGAACMADAYARVSGRLTVLSVHQGPGVTNALTGIAEAAKSRTPLIVLAPEATNPRSNFHVDLAGLAAALGAGFHRVRAGSVAADVAYACRTATSGAGRTVVLGLPLDVQSMPAEPTAEPTGAATGGPPAEAGSPRTGAGAGAEEPAGVAALVAALRAAHRPVFVAGRGAGRQAASARPALIALAGACGALLATSAAARGLFEGEPWDLDVCGGFATPLAAELVRAADLVVAWGGTLNMWTTRHGRLIGPTAVVAQVDLDPAAIGVNRPVDVAVTGDVTAVALACARELGRHAAGAAVAGTAEPSGTAGTEGSNGTAGAGGWRTPDLRARIAARGRWRDEPYADESGDGRIDPRTLTIALDDLLPPQRTVVIDSGNFMGYPSMFLSVPDAAGFCFTQAFQSVGLGLASALGAAVARPDRLTVAALGDGGFAMSVAELATAVRLAAPLLVVIYNDAAYGAEVHHFGPHGHPLDTVTFPESDLAAIARGFGCAGATVRTPDDLAAVRTWLAGPRERPLVLDAKVTSRQGSWWLREAFQGH